MKSIDTNGSDITNFTILDLGKNLLCIYKGPFK